MLNPESFRDIAKGDIHVFNGYAIFMRKDGFIQIQFENDFSGDVEDARNMISTMRQLKETPKCYMLVVYGDDNTFTKETREFIASDEVSELVAVDALVVKGLAMKIVGNGYLRINKPKRPTRLFNSPEVAVKWLQQFKENEARGSGKNKRYYQ